MVGDSQQRATDKIPGTKSGREVQYAGHTLQPLQTGAGESQGSAQYSKPPPQQILPSPAENQENTLIQMNFPDHTFPRGVTTSKLKA